MTATIAYDQPVRNLIDQLSATGHVTHTAYRKTMVTLHHNGGRLSHDGCLNVWKTRPASAHFDVDSQGRVAQFVKPNEYAWAVGNTAGNQKSISIEMANLTLDPTWQVSDITWMGAARLAGWLFARVIGERPTSSIFVPHHFWKPTLCAGPYMDLMWPNVVNETTRWYETFSAKVPVRPTVPTGGRPGVQTLLRLGSRGDAVRKLQTFLRDVFPAYKDSVTVRRHHLLDIDGNFGLQTEAWVCEFQRRTGLAPDGVVGPNTYAKLRHFGFRG